jgi:integrase/recombinase XerD
MRYCADRAISPDGSVSWVVVNADYRLHAEGCAFLAGLRGADRSVNTEGVYAGRVALFLGWCATTGLDWARVSLGQMVEFKRWLVEVALPPRRRDGAGPARFRSARSADAVLGTVCEFLRFCANQGLGAPVEVARRFYEPRYLTHAPAGVRDRGGRPVPHGAVPAAGLNCR